MGHFDRRFQPEAGRVSKTMKGSAKLNARLEVFRESVLGIYREGMISGQKVTPALIRQKLEKEDVQAPVKNLQLKDRFNEFVEASRAVKRDNTIKTYHTALNRLTDFERKHRVVLTLDEMDSAFYTSWVADMVDQGYNNNYIGKMIKILKTFLYWCQERELDVNPRFINFKPLSSEVHSIALREDELAKLTTVDLSKTPGKSKARDLFLIQCYTGLRYSDIRLLTADNIIGNEIHIQAKKTSRSIVIPILPQIASLIDKFRAAGFPKLASQKFNEYIKEVCDVAGIDESVVVHHHSGSSRSSESIPKFKLVSSHTGRRTFITLSKQHGIPDDVIMSITGHTDIRTMLKYNKLNNDAAKRTFLGGWAS